MENQNYHNMNALKPPLMDIKCYQSNLRSSHTFGADVDQWLKQWSSRALEV